MVTAVRRWFARQRTDAVRLRMFSRQPRVRPGPLPYLTPEEQHVYEQACRNVQAYRPVTGERGR